MIELAQSERCIPVLPEQLDADPWLLNCLNGVLDLRTGRLHPHRRGDLFTKLAPVAYEPEAECPTWKAFLHSIMDGNRELIGFLQRFAGYALTGVIREHVLVICYGTGSNGKSTFLETLTSLMGDYAWQAPPRLAHAQESRRSSDRRRRVVRSALRRVHRDGVGPSPRRGAHEDAYRR